MAADKDGDVGTGKPAGKPKPVTVTVDNLAAQPVELKLRGRWVRWEPRGLPGSSRELSVEEAASSVLAAIAFLRRRS